MPEPIGHSVAAAGRIPGLDHFTNPETHCETLTVSREDDGDSLEVGDGVVSGVYDTVVTIFFLPDAPRPTVGW